MTSLWDIERMGSANHRNRMHSLRSNAVDRWITVDDARKGARRVLAAQLFDYLEGGAGEELTSRSNIAAFRDRQFVPRVLRGEGDVDISCVVGGGSAAFPLVLSPTAFTSLFHPDAEVPVSTAACRAKVPYTLSMLSSTAIEDVARATERAFWFQLLRLDARPAIADILDRLKENRCDTIVVTVDSPVLAKRTRDARHRLALPAAGPRVAASRWRRPTWALRGLRQESMALPNIPSVQRRTPSGPLAQEFINDHCDPFMSWDDIEWIRERWPGHLLLKGVQAPSDARRAAAIGVNGFFASNHGGRQLDRSRASLHIATDLRDAVGDDLTIICDGGIRSGYDIAVALACGADACAIGRPYVYGLAAAGERGVGQVIRILRDELEEAMTLLGVSDITSLDISLLARSPSA
jgi:L-lactate dehydrogenase (cytochrome)